MRQSYPRARNSIFVAALIAVSCCCAAFPSVARAEPSAAATRSENAPAVDLAKLYDTVVETIDRRFVDEELLRTLDWQGRARAVRPSVLSAPTVEEAVGRINELLSELKTSHTGLYTPDDYRYHITLDVLSGAPNTADLVAERFWGSGPYYPGTGAFTAKVGDRHFVDGVMEGSPADKAGLKFGDEILSVDGVAYSPIAAFRGKVGTTAELAIRRDRDAEPKRLRVPVVPIRPSAAFSAATIASARVIERNGRRVGYIHVWSTNEARSFKAALAAVYPSYPGAVPITPTPQRRTSPPLDALIVDMRGRVGGNIGVASEMLDVLGPTRKPYWGHWQSRSRADIARDGFGVLRQWEPQAPPFQMRSAILIDHQTRSASEFMAYGYKLSGFGLVVGTPTAGAVSSGGLFTMPGDLLLYVALSTAEFGGKRLEGVGVAPDHRVERPLPYAAGADPVLDAAVDHLTKVTSP